MTGLVRKATLLTAVGLITAASAFANIPSPAQCTVPCSIVLVGQNGAGTAADPYGQFVVVVKDAVSNPVAGAVVTCDFSGCCSLGFRLGSSQLGVGVSHPSNAVVTAITDASGTATFRIEGSSNGTIGASLESQVGCATISATPTSGTPVLLTDGSAHKTVIVATPDEDGAGGITVTDMSLWINDKNAYSGGQIHYRQRSDFDFHLTCVIAAGLSNGNGITVTDQSQLIGIKNSTNSAISSPPVACP